MAEVDAHQQQWRLRGNRRHRATMKKSEWRKSTRSGSNGGACVEIRVVWRKSTRSGENGGACVEVAVVDQSK
jgi:hypothetical protein